jgi:nucleoside-diphosphate-sugar epimerase
MRVLILGCGYFGRVLGQELFSLGHKVTGVVESSDSLKSLQTSGINPVACDVTNPETLMNHVFHRSAYDVVVFSVASRGRDYESVYLRGMQSVLTCLASFPIQTLIYTGSTSVYAQQDGGWVTEESPTIPNTRDSEILLRTEELIHQGCLTSKMQGVILRISGIYGPGRHHVLDQLRQGLKSFVGSGHRWMNQVHRDDVVGAVLHLLENPNLLTGPTPATIYNISDDEPVTREVYINWVASRLGNSYGKVDFNDQRTDSRRESKRRLANRRISNQRLRNAGWKLKYPSFREGLSALVT